MIATIVIMCIIIVFLLQKVWALHHLLDETIELMGKISNVIKEQDDHIKGIHKSVDDMSNHFKNFKNKV